MRADLTYQGIFAVTEQNVKLGFIGWDSLAGSRTFHRDWQRPNRTRRQMSTLRAVWVRTDCYVVKSVRP